MWVASALLHRGSSPSLLSSHLLGHLLGAQRHEAISHGAHCELLRPEGIHIAALISHQSPCWKGQHLRVCSPKGCQPQGTQLDCEAVSWGWGSTSSLCH